MRNITGSVAANVLSVIVNTLVLLLLYRMLLFEIGVEGVGMWSLLTAFASIARASGTGFSSGVARYVALSRSGDSSISAAESIGVSVILSLIIGGAVSALILVLAPALLEIAVTGAAAVELIRFLPVAALSFLVSLVFLILGGALEGLGKAYIKSAILAISSILHLAIVYYVVPLYGLEGMVWSQLAHSILLVVFVLVSFALPAVKLSIKMPRNFKSYRVIASYSLKVQAANMLSMLYEPSTKYLIAFFSDQSVVGVYEVASKLVLHTRNLISSSLQILVPFFIVPKGTGNKSLEFLSMTKDYTIYFSVFLYGLLSLSLPVFSVFWMKIISVEFILVSNLLILGWFWNTVAIPKYVHNISNGRMRINIVSQVVCAFLNMFLGLLLGGEFSWYGVVVGWVVSLVIGALLVESDMSMSHIGLSFKIVFDSLLSFSANIALVLVFVLIFTLPFLKPVMVLLSLISFTLFFILMLRASSRYPGLVSLIQVFRSRMPRVFQQ